MAAPDIETAPEQGFALFETTVGRCAIAWGDRGLLSVHLPERTLSELRKQVARRVPSAIESTPPRTVQVTVDAIVALLRGQVTDLSFADLDMEGLPPFHQLVYEVARTIPAGETLTYGELAGKLGSPGAARAVGQALGRNPFAIVVPCHRVVAAGGKLGGFSADGGTATKSRLLAIERTMLGSAMADADDPDALAFDRWAAVEHLTVRDPVLGRVVATAGPFKLGLKKAPSTFAALAEAIVYQQLSPKAAATIFGRLCALFPGPGEYPAPQQLTRVSDERLRSAGLSRAKALALRDLALRTLDGAVPTLDEARVLDDEAIIGRLTEVRGIGRWTAEMFLIFRLGRPDVLPVSDFALRRGFAIAFKKKELPDGESVARRGMRWQPYRSVATWYLWRVAEEHA